MRQTGDRICGEYSGGLVNLRQVDEGYISGTADDDVATLDVSSERNGEMARVHVLRTGDGLHWKQVGTPHGGATDISVIAINEVLTPVTHTAPAPERCNHRS